MAVGDTVLLQLGANIVDLGACFQTVISFPAYM
jgi:hypothetical protein